MESNLVKNAIEALRLRGISVERSEMPGLYNVGGRELTTGHVIDYAYQLRDKDAR